MTLPSGMSEKDFQAELHKVVSQSSPINERNRLFGRDDVLKKISRGLSAPGRHVFIYGDRGVGKTSAAIIGAQIHTEQDGCFVHLGCATDSSFKFICANIIQQALRISKFSAVKTQGSFSIDLKIIRLARSQDFSDKVIADEIASVSDAVYMFRELSEVIKNVTVVVDEFDKLDVLDRKLFADLVKLVGDQGVGIKFIFTGVATDIDDLLSGHASSIRQLDNISLDKMSYDSRWKILESACAHFGLSVDHEVLVKASMVCDGYPYYLHLIAERILYLVYEQDQIIRHVDLSIYMHALEHAIENTMPQLRQPYAKAIAIPSNDNEAVLWATADTDYYDRFLRDYFLSYEIIARRLGGIKLDYAAFSKRVRDLRKAERGAILEPGIKKGLYSYRDRMLRGYVRMQAAAHGIELQSDVIKDPSIPTAQPGSMTRGYRGGSAPRGYGGSYWPDYDSD